MISFCRNKCQTLSMKLCGLLVKLPSLRLRRGVKCGRKTHGRLVVSFTVKKSFVKCIDVSELHLTAHSLTDAILTSSPPCANISNGVPLLPPQFTPHCPCSVLLRHLSHLSESLAKAVSSIRLSALPRSPCSCRDTCQCYLCVIVPSWDFPLFSPQSLPSTFCHTCLRCVACIGKWLS